MSDSSVPVDTRRSSRLSLSLPIVIHGKDADQKAYRESTQTLIVNQHGAKIVTAQQLAVGAEILVENPNLGSVAKANVVWLSPRRNANGLFEVGIQLVEAQNVWGLEFPPADWTAQPSESAAGHAAPSARRVAEPSAPVRTPPAPSTSEQIATQFLQELKETTEAHARKFGQRLDQVVQRMGLEWEMRMQERSEAAREHEFAAWDEQVLASGERLNELKAELEQLNARLVESQIALCAAMESVPPPMTSEQIQAKLQEDALPVLNLITESGIAAARERIQAQMQADTSQAVAAWRSQVQGEKDSLLQETRQLIAAANSAVGELNRQREAAFEDVKRQIQAETQENLGKVGLLLKTQIDETAGHHVESLVARLNDAAREVGERQASLLQTQLDALLISRLDQAQRRAQSLGDDLQSRVEEGLRAARESHAEELRAQLQKTADEVLASSEQARKRLEESAHTAEKTFQELQGRLQSLSAQTVAATSSQLRAQAEAVAGEAMDKSLERCRMRLQELIEKAVASSSDQMRSKILVMGQAATDEALQTWKARLQNIANGIADASSQRMRGQIAETARLTAEQGLQAWQTRLQAVADKTVASTAEQVRSRLAEVVDQTAAARSDQVQRQINEALSMMGPKLQELQERAVNDALDAFRSRLSQFLGMLQTGSK